MKCLFRIIFGLLISTAFMHAETYVIDDAATWKKITSSKGVTLEAGDKLLLKRGATYPGKLVVRARGKAGNPALVGACGEGAAPVIDAAGYHAGIQIIGSKHLVVEGIEIVGDGGAPKDGADPTRRYGVLLLPGKGEACENIILRNLNIHDIYSHKGAKHEGKNPTTHIGTAIRIAGGKNETTISGISVIGCRIERTGFKAIELRNVRNALVENNYMKDIGGPAIQPGVVEDLVVRGNTVDGSGSSLDPRMHMRGSGIWPWTSKRILIEKNTFMHARGKGDSCGIHIDFNCHDVVVQYNLSIDNEGGFVEILGNCYNSAYRYNISVNDGARVKGKNGAHQEGKVLWTSGYVGAKQKKVGPYNSYIYNNTVYVGPNSRSCFSITGTTDGLLVANNIFHIMGSTVDVLGDQDKRKDKIVSQLERVDVRNNLWLRSDLLPETVPFKDDNPFTGDAGFANPGGLKLTDYVPDNIKLVQDKGIVIPKLPGDKIGLRIGLAVEEDILGNRIHGNPDLGAIEIPAELK